MPAVKDKNGTWISRFYSLNYLGEKKQHFKRGFKTKKEALEYERETLAKANFNTSMSFGVLYELYLDDISNRLREHTIIGKKYLIETKILPFFRNMKLESVTPIVIRKWQNELLNTLNPKTNKPYTQTYIKTINNQLVAIFNYARKYHSLKENPCHLAGTIGKKNAEEMEIWTCEEFDKFINELKNKPISYMGFTLLFWSGMRIGELLALTVKDIDFDKNKIKINKSYQRLKGKDIITAPKTPKNKRDIDIPSDIMLLLKEYLNKLYKYTANTRLFNCTKHQFEHDIDTYSKKAGVKKIRVHDLRHSHASYLINHNVNILAISNRLGHEKIETTLNIYSHLYKESQNYMIDILNNRK